MLRRGPGLEAETEAYLTSNGAHVGLEVRVAGLSLDVSVARHVDLDTSANSETVKVRAEVAVVFVASLRVEQYTVRGNVPEAGRCTDCAVVIERIVA
jgi:hypothetical protein